MALTEFFLRPLWLLALPLLLGLCYWLSGRHADQGGWAKLIDAELLPSLKLESAEKQRRSPWPWVALAWTLAALALAGPSWQSVSSSAFRGNATWVVLLDLSPSMKAADLLPDRITRARYALDDLLNAARDARVGLVAFGDEAYTVTPVTDDVATIKTLLPPLNPDIMPSAGDHLAPALQQAGKLIGDAQGAQVIVLTDGFSDPAASFETAKKLQAAGVTVHVVGIGTAGGAPLALSGGGFAQNAKGGLNLARLDVSQLEQLAVSGGGRYVTPAQLPSLIESLQARNEGLRGATQDVRVVHRLDGGIWLLPLLLIIAALLSRKGWL
jgi:Ca-activated chloride channel family protein